MFRFLALLSLVLSVFSDELALAVTENDPSTLVEGVSMITGDLYALEEDYVVQGAEPIHLRRSFISREGIFKSYQHLTATFACTSNHFSVNEHNGTTLYYFADPKNQLHPQIGEQFYGNKPKQRKVLRYNAHDFAQKAKGVSNTSSGKISAQTHLKNQYIIFDSTLDNKGKSFTLHASDGTKRRYVKFERQKPAEHHPFKGLYLSYEYKLESETLPNGHILHYHWDGENRIDRIYTTNAALNKTFAQVTIPVFPKSTPPPSEVTLTGTDGCSVTYKFHPTEVKYQFVQSDVISPDLPDQHFSWDLKLRRFGYEQKKMPYLQILSLKQNRAMRIAYTDEEDPVARQMKIDERLGDIRKQIKEIKPKAKKKPTKYQQRLNLLKGEEEWILKNGIENEGVLQGYLVKTLSAPVGKDATLITTHTFIYDKPNKNSYVLDVKNNKTAYFWNDDYRLTRIERYMGTQGFHSADTFLWENTHLRCKTFHDEKWTPLSSRVLTYDNLGNVTTETTYGNLTGKSPPLKIGPNGFPVENGVERFVRTTTHSEDGRNLILKQEDPSTGLIVKYTYLNDAHLLKTKSVCDGSQAKIQTTYEYNGDLILQSETTDDGISRVMKRITPCQSSPYIGMPEIIEELYGDEILLRKTVLHYGKGASIEQKDIYDANNKLRYSLKMTYDAKGRLKTETNAAGQEASYDYDEVGNRKYAKDFSGRLETFYQYDCSNRLIKKEEKGDDSIHREYTYEYDTKHNLISETDPYKNKTTYTPDPFDNRTEIHLPPVPNEKGELIHSATTFKYNSAGSQIEQQDAANKITKTDYNASGKPILITHPDKATEEFTYDLNGNLKTYTDPKKVTTSYEYDYLNRVLKKTTGNAEETFEYTGQYLSQKTDAEKNKTIYKYDLAGRKLNEESFGEETTYTYDEFSRLRTTQKGDLITLTEYNLLNQVTEERNESPSGKVFRRINYEYDTAGNQKTIIRNINGTEQKEELQYDSLNRLIERKDALGFIETYEYDLKVNKKTHTDPIGLQTIEISNSQNQIASIEKKKGQKTLALEQKYYNQNGKLALQTNTIYSPDGTQREIHTRWEYNSRGLLKTLIEADGTLNAKITRYEYTPRGELETVTKPDGTTLSYRYNDLGQLEYLISSDGTVSYQMKYNLLGHLIESGPLTRTTDPFGRILSETFPHGHSIQNTYDKRGRRDTCLIPLAGCLITYEYDPVNLKKVNRSKLDKTLLYSHAYTSHDLSGNSTEQELIQNTGTLQFTIDPLSRKTAIASPNFSQEVLEFDPVGNIQKMRIQAEQITYTYDDLYQLTSESGLFSHSYAYDSLHNRLQKDDEKHEINTLNQVTSHFEYDKNGNPTQHNETTYTYDALDRLIRIETPLFIQTLTYDCLHRCLSKTITQNSTSKTLYFLYDGKNEIGAFDETNNPIQLRILGEAPHAEIGAAIAIELNGNTHVPIHDLQGNLAALIPIDNSSPTTYRYSAFGEEQITGLSTNPWRFCSKRADQTTGLINFGRRHYLPELGRWLTPDPAGFSDGMNLYAYLHNDPLTHFDEYGLIMMARDYKSIQQITSAPWESNRPWSTASYYGRNIASKITHDLYDNYVAPFKADYDRCLDLFSSNPAAHESNSGKPQTLDQFFGTNIASSKQNRTQFRERMGIQFTEAGIPFGPGGVISGASRVSTAVSKLFQNSKALSPAIKLSSSAAGETAQALTAFWPPNRGFIGEIKREYLMPGTLIDRFGNAKGKYFSPNGTPFKSRALPPYYLENEPRIIYEILKPFEVNSGIVSPAFGKMGLGVQYEAPVTVKTLLKRGFIRQTNGI